VCVYYVVVLYNVSYSHRQKRNKQKRNWIELTKWWSEELEKDTREDNKGQECKSVGRVCEKLFLLTFRKKYFINIKNRNIIKIK
jgi:hypothetical protein